MRKEHAEPALEVADFVMHAARRLSAAREAARREGVPIVLNARCDVFHLQHGEESTRFAATVERCKAYVAAGADCVYPFGLRDPATIAAFVKAIGAPVEPACPMRKHWSAWASRVLLSLRPRHW
jgi:2-methylisocitrate lyase-like PEP mutase family enzyme